MAATAVADRDAAASYEAFRTISGEVAAALHLALQTEETLVMNAAAYFVDRPAATTTEFAQ